jgi:hypothetical protein
VTNWGEEVEAGADGKANRDDQKITSSRSPLKVVFPSDDIVY